MLEKIFHHSVIKRNGSQKNRSKKKDGPTPIDIASKPQEEGVSHTPKYHGHNPIPDGEWWTASQRVKSERPELVPVRHYARSIRIP